MARQKSCGWIKPPCCRSRALDRVVQFAHVYRAWIAEPGRLGLGRQPRLACSFLLTWCSQRPSAKEGYLPGAARNGRQAGGQTPRAGRKGFRKRPAPTSPARSRLVVATTADIQLDRLRATPPIYFRLLQHHAQLACGQGISEISSSRMVAASPVRTCRHLSRDGAGERALSWPNKVASQTCCRGSPRS